MGQSSAMTPDLSSLPLTTKTIDSAISIPMADTDATLNVPSHRSHDPRDNMKRSDPFQFGSRYLEKGDDVFEFNAWDHVTPDDAYFAYAESQYTAQREHPVSEFDKKRFNLDPEKWWNKFYSNNTNNFFKNRKWLHQEFPILSQLTKKGAGPARILEVGAGAGNTAFPLLKANENEEMTIYAYDFSKQAVELIRANEAYDGQKIQADVWDIAALDLPPGVKENSLDVVILIFVFSALSPSQWRRAIENVFKLLRPGGEVCFRDYGRGDLTQVRFKKGRLLEESFYIRGDGTRVYFFEENELRNIWTAQGHDKPRQEGVSALGAHDGDLDTQSQAFEHSAPKFEILQLGADRRMLVNRQKQLKMYRCWLQGRFRKITSQET